MSRFRGDGKSNVDLVSGASDRRFADADLPERAYTTRPGQN